MSSARWGWRRLLGAALAVSAAVTVVTAGGAQAAGSKATDTSAIDTSDNHEMGAAIRAHDGVTPPGAVPSSVDASVPGIDVSSYQGNVNWASYWSAGKKFAYVKATEGTGYTNAYFTQQYNGSYNVGMIRGAYHYGRPDLSGGAAQADYFVAHGGGWSKDGKTLPPMLDIEYAPSGDQCYGLTQAAMRTWIQAFSNEVHAKTTRYATVYTTTDWWTKCTGNWSGLSQTNPLFIARYSSSVGTLPAGWGTWTFWQFADSGTFPGDQDYFNGPLSGLKNLANNT
jgi:GH25 family lysozyme M1 (1,4-beta-N-acetylmuramidase)